MGQSAQKPNYTPFGSVFEPIGWINGKPVWPVLGGADDDGAQSGNGGTAGDGNGDGTGQSAGEQGSDGDGKGSEGDGQSAEESDDDKPVTRAEFDRLRNQLSAADKKREEAEAKVRKFEDANKSELEKAQAERDKANEERDSAREQLLEVGIREAFRDTSEELKHSWHNTKVAMRLLDKDLYQVADDGTISGMEKAVKALAKDHAYLLKAANSNDGGGRPSGAPLNGGGSGKPTTDKAKLAKKYRALQGRGGE
jgi:flagellar biosynthesis GTPase FlhF